MRNAHTTWHLARALLLFLGCANPQHQDNAAETDAGIKAVNAHFMAALSESDTAYEVGNNASVNIVYPIDGGTYPIADPSPSGVKSAYLPFSFSVTCPGGNHDVEWGIDGDQLGEVYYYDQSSQQFVWKVAGGAHTFWVRTSCGDGKVQFKVG